MNYLLVFLPDPYLKAMADYFATEEPPFPPPATPTVSSAILACGESILVWFSESVSAKLHSRTSRTVPKLYLPPGIATLPVAVNTISVSDPIDILMLIDPTGCTTLRNECNAAAQFN
jgi:hypothetical protein